MPPEVLFKKAIIHAVVHLASFSDPWGLTKREIAEGAGISEGHLHRVWPVLERYELVKPVKKVGPATLYFINRESPIVRAYLGLLDEIGRADAELASKEGKPAETVLA
ncbi:MAG: hypothetical protein ACE5OY_06615 [Candidatus Bathyarchaeia archaeon]